MTVWTFKTSSDFGNDLFLDIALDGINCLDEVEESLSHIGLHPATVCPEISIVESLNIFWKNLLEVKTQKLDSIDRFGEGLVRANVVSANRTEQIRHYAVRRFFTHIHKSRNGVLSLRSGIFVFKLSGNIEE